MWAHQQAEHQKDPRPRRRPRDADAPSDAARVLALQRTVGNAAVAAAIGDTVVQRTSQTEENAEETGEQDQSRGRVADREQALSTRFGIRIGPADAGGRHFTHRLLDRIEAALRELPIADLRDNNQLIAIEMDTSAGGSATLYDEDTQSVGVVRPVTPIGVRAPAWLYAAMNMDKPWQLALMDRGAMADYQGITKQGDRELGIPKGSRGVMTPQGSLLQWTIRHEVGHSVDQNISWNMDLAQQDHFGGWRTYPGTTERDAIAEAILQHAQLDNVLLPNQLNNSVASLSSILNPKLVRGGVTSGRLDRYFNRFTPQTTNLAAAEITTRKNQAIHFVKLAIAQPWTLANGGEDILAVNGRVYQLDPYEDWCSYLANQRQYQVSRYQFSNPKEWFAEAYAAYYNRNRPELREQLHPQVRAWFDARAPQTDDDRTA